MNIDFVSFLKRVRGIADKPYECTFPNCLCNARVICSYEARANALKKNRIHPDDCECDRCSVSADNVRNRLRS